MAAQAGACVVHYEICEYCQNTSKVQAQVVQNLRVYWCLSPKDDLWPRLWLMCHSRSRLISSLILLEPPG